MTEIFDITAGATIYGYTDRYACTIIAASATRITVQEDIATLLNGPNSGESDALNFSPGGFVGHVEGVQRWSYTPDPTARKRTFSLRKSGRWVESGQKDSLHSNRLRPGKKAHYDFNF